MDSWTRTLALFVLQAVDVRYYFSMALTKIIVAWNIAQRNLIDVRGSRFILNVGERLGD